MTEVANPPPQSQCHDFGTNNPDVEETEASAQRSVIPAAVAHTSIGGTYHHTTIQSRKEQSRPSVSQAGNPSREGCSPGDDHPLSPENVYTHGAPASQRTTANERQPESVAALQASPMRDEDQAQVNFSSPMQNDNSWTAQEMQSFANFPPIDGGLLPDNVISPSVSSGYHIEDGIFEPGSAYQNLFQSLRSHIFRTAQFEIDQSHRDYAMGRDRNKLARNAGGLNNTLAVSQPNNDIESGDGAETPSFELRPAQEYLLWKAWTEEVSLWLDKFDPQTHFRDYFPIIAKERPHLKYAMLSLSARYLESRNSGVAPSLTLALYQHTIQLLLPQLYMRDTAVIASCVILCVLEMFSCSPKAWRRHLDGCASLMQSLDIRGDGGGAEEAVFWCFSRMDLCGGLISLERTLIPVEKWTSDSVSEVSVSTYPRASGFQYYAKMASNILAQTMDLFSAYHASEGAFGFSAANPLESEAYGRRWRRLFEVIQDWFDTRPMEMLPVMAMSAKDCGSPFPTVLYSNAAAISGNQFAHTAAILMLQRKPRDLALGKVRSILWHARQICGIALSNDHHGAWTNTVQPIWIAGKLMSHPQEHGAIVCLLRRIERETGWATQWRIDDLMEYWGDADSDN